MLQSEFYEKLTAYMVSDDLDSIPSLLTQARADHLKIAVVSRNHKEDDEGIPALFTESEGRTFLMCAVSPEDPQYDEDLYKNQGIIIVEMDIVELFEGLSESDVHGISFEKGNQVCDFEWRDILPEYRNHWDSERNGTRIQDVPKVGPNDPCPCGSGKKYKRCCGR